ncbi:MAG: hypothetical protein WC683_18780 [bacterium]
MARIRSIHPGLFTDEAFMTLTVESPASIALMIGLWVEADDSGTFEWKPLTLKARILPAADGSINNLLDAIEGVGMVRKFDIEGRTFGVIRNFVKYQRPKKPKDIHPFTIESRVFAGFDKDGRRPHSEVGRPPNDESSELITAEFGTGSENRRQRKEEGGRSIIPVSLPSVEKQAEPIQASALDEDPKDVLFGETIDWLAETTGRGKPALRSAIGQLLKLAGGDAHAGFVLGVIRDAKRANKADPISWAMAIVKARDRPQQRGQTAPPPQISSAFRLSKPAARAG